MCPRKKAEISAKRPRSEHTLREMKPVYFPSPPDWHAWLEQHHEKHHELWVGLHKKDSGKPSITWPEAVDGALCFGWIDGVRKSISETSYVIRFTPRRPRSIWSAINIKRVGELTTLGLMRPAGLQAFERRQGDRSAIYAYEQRKGAKLRGVYEKKFRANKKAWKFFQAQPPWYQRTASWWVISAKKEETRLKRLAQLIEDSEHERTILELRRAESK
jgi:uncharacterized protein YdeI (YjbR/CyaY-like superfamily)